MSEERDLEALGSDVFLIGRKRIKGGGGFREVRIPSMLLEPLQVLSAVKTFYVSNDGSDAAGDGSQGSPWETLQHACEWVADNIVQNGYEVTIQCAAGTYDGVYLNRPFSGKVFIYGDNDARANYIVNAAAPLYCGFCFESQQFNVRIQGFEIHVGAYAVGIQANYARITTGYVKFVGATDAFAALYASNGGFIGSVWYYAPVVITGSFDYTIGAAGSGYVDFLFALTVTGLDSVYAFLDAEHKSHITFYTSSITGTSTGPKFFVNAGASINTFGRTIPGDEDGVTNTGGLVV